MVEVLSHPFWQSMGVISAVIFGMIGFYYAGRQRFWLFAAGAIAVFIMGLAVGSFAERHTNVNSGEPEIGDRVKQDTLAIADIPFSVFAWSRADVAAEQGWANMSAVNNLDATQSYRLDYSLPYSSTQYSGAGVTFKFDEPLDASTFSHIAVDITFKSADDICYLMLYDISNHFSPFPLGRVSSNYAGVRVSSNDSSQTYSVSLEDHFPSVNRKVIREVACAIDTTNSIGEHSFTIHGIAFERR